MSTHRENSDKIFNITFNELSGLNLTSISDSNEFFLKQYWDSIFPFLELPELCELIQKYENILDVGFGGGFPILPLSLNFPQKNIFGIDSKNKKVEAVNLISNKMNIENMKVKHLRLEELNIDYDCLVTFKAVGKIADYLNKINTEKNVSVLFLKGRNLRELEEVPDQINEFGLQREIDYQLSPEIFRKLVIYKKNVLRGTKPRNNLVKLSSFD